MADLEPNNNEPQPTSHFDDPDNKADDFVINEFGETVNWELGVDSTADNGSQSKFSDPPTKIGRYEIHGVLGRGGFGAVYLGYDSQLDRKVAIKVPRIEVNDEIQQLFITEARQLAQLTHPSIVTVHDVGVEDGICYIVSEYLEGKDLNRWLAGKEISWQESAEIVIPLAEALASAHASNTVHRDVKPANVIMTSRNQKTVPVLVDFGMAISEMSAGSASTKRGSVAGTPNYMSPEQAQGEGHRIDGRTDVSSLGVILYRLISGQLAFTAPNVKDLLVAVICDEPRPPRQFVHTIPKELERICLKALAKKIGDRYTTAGDFADELRSLLKQHRKENQAGRAIAQPQDKIAGRASMKILIADDDELSRFKLQSDLKKWGHEIVAAEDGAHAWELFQKDEFSIVVTDWMMPNVDGPELVRKIRAANLANYVYIIMLTAKSERHDIITGMGAGADDFLSKPFHRDELQVRLRAGIRITKMNRELNETNQRLLRSQKAATEIRRSYLPTDDIAIDGFDIAWDYKPCANTGNDMFNIVQLDDQHVALYVLDVSGEGVPSTLLASSLSRVLSPASDAQSLLVERDGGNYQLLEPSRVIQKLNSQFGGNLEAKQFFTIAYGVLNRETRRFRVSSAGHPPLLYQASGKTPAMLDIDSFPLGMAPPSSTFEQQTVNLESGDRLLLYSDGLTDAMNNYGEVFGAARLLELINGQQDASSDQLIRRVASEIDQWRQGAEMNDDLSVLALTTL